MNRFLKDHSGVTAVEYGVIVLFMTLVIIGTVATLGEVTLTQLFQKIASSM